MQFLLQMEACEVENFLNFFCCWLPTWGWVNEKMTQLKGNLNHFIVITRYQQLHICYFYNLFSYVKHHPPPSLTRHLCATSQKTNGEDEALSHWLFKKQSWKEQVNKQMFDIILASFSKDYYGPGMSCNGKDIYI